MRVLFIYTDISSAVGYSAGIGILSAILKREGHDTRLIHVSGELDYPLDHSRISRDICDYQPGLICFSVTTNQWYFANQIGEGIKKEFHIPIIVGGHHPTADPEKVISKPWVDIVCRGEGDVALKDVVTRISKGQSLRGIPNIFFKEDGEIIREPLLSWVEDMDALPYDDREVFNYQKIVETRAGWAEVIVTRGCPYPCTYCFNTPLLNLYQKDILNSKGLTLKKSDMIRRRSVDATITMLKQMKKDYPNIKAFTFVDDVMAKEGAWFDEFTERYAKEIGLPYACTSQPLLFNRKIARQLKDSGCKVVKMGIEAGNEEIRKKVLKRNISEKRLVEVFGLARECGLKPQAFNMIGLPGETLDNLMETVRLNAAIKPYVVWLSTFIPYPGTELYQECVKKGLIDESKWDKVDSYRGDSVLKDEYLPPLDFRKIRVMFRWYLNANLGNGASSVYSDHIRKLSSLPDEQWQDGTAEKLFLETDAQLDMQMRKNDISHYVSKKYINLFWGNEYNYDLT